MTDVWGGGVVILATAVLWLAYLIPSWYRRYEYGVSQRAAVRIQRTLHVLAATSEVPEEVRIEATARQAVRQEKAARRAWKLDAARARVEERAELAGRKASLEAARRRAREAERDRARDEARQRSAARARSREASSRVGITGGGRLSADALPGAARPSRAAAARAGRGLVGRASLVRRRMRARRAALAVLVAGGVGAVVAVMLLRGPGAWLLGVPCVVAGVLAFWVLARLARPMAQAARPATAPRPTAGGRMAAPASSRATASRLWTPVPLPRPLHLEPGTRAARAMASVDAEVRWRRESVLSELTARIEHPAEAASVRHIAAARLAGAAEPDQAAAEGLAATGSVEVGFGGRGRPSGTAGHTFDLDGALRRRRVV